MPSPDRGPRWKVAVIADDPEVLDRTGQVLSGLVVCGRRLDVLSASSAAQGRDLMRRHADIAAVLLDLTASNDSGRDFVGYVRETLGNRTVRIIPDRSGGVRQPRSIRPGGSDGKARAGFTADGLFTALTAALQSYREVQRAAEMRRGLELVIDAAQTLTDLTSLQRLGEGVLTQTAALLSCECGGIVVLRERGEDAGSVVVGSVLAGSGIYRGSCDTAELEPQLREAVSAAFRLRAHQFLPRHSALYIKSGSSPALVALVECGDDLSENDLAVLGIFAGRLAATFDNVTRHEEIEDGDGRPKRPRQRRRGLQKANTASARWTRLHRANAFKSEVLRIIAHDLRNPLGVILGRAEMLSGMVEEAALPADGIKIQIAHIRTAAQRVMAFIERLIADARADALDISIRPQPVDLVTLLRDLVEANQPLAARKRQTITFAASEAIEVMCDPDRIREAADNLVGNAMKYSPVGGRIDVAANRSHPGVVIRITDQGPGLSAADLARLFVRFQRLSAKPTGGESSTGLGLSIVKRIVELHGGTVVAETTGPSGTTFRIAIPSPSQTSGTGGM